MTIERVAPERRPLYVTTLALILLLWPATIVVPPFLSLVAGQRNLTIGMAPPPSTGDVASEHTLHVWAAVLALMLPTFGLIVAALSHRPVNAVAFGLVLILYAIVVMGSVRASHPKPVPSQTPAVTQCVRDCPGG